MLSSEEREEEKDGWTAREGMERSKQGEGGAWKKRLVGGRKVRGGTRQQGEEGKARR